MKAPTGRNARVSVREKAMALSGRWNSCAMAVKERATRKKSKASRVQPRKLASTAAPWLGWVGGAAGGTGMVSPCCAATVMQSRQLTIPSPDSASQRVEWVFGFMTVEAGIFRSMKKEKGKTDAFRFTRGPGARLLS